MFVCHLLLLVIRFSTSSLRRRRRRRLSGVHLLDAGCLRLTVLFAPLSPYSFFGT
jgi:hypothetical protein